MNSPTSHAQHNLELLLTHHSHVGKSLLEYLQTQRREGRNTSCQTIHTPSSQPALVTQYKGQQTFLHDVNDPKRISLQYAEDILENPPGLTVIYSSGLGYLPVALSPILEEHRIALIEPDYDILFLSLQTSDWRTLLSSGNFLLHAGPKALDESKKILQQHGSLMESGIRVIPGRILLPGEREIMDELTDLCETSRANFLCYQSTSAYPEPKSVSVALTEAHQDLRETLCSECRQNGMSASSSIRHKSTLRFTKDNVPVREILGYPLPGTVLALSPNVFTSSEWEVMGKHDIRRILWFFDDPFRFDLDDIIKNPIDTYFCFDPHLTEKLRKTYSLHVDYLPAGTSFPNGISGIPPSPVPSQLDVSFVGSTGLHRMEEKFIQWLSSNPPAIHAFRDAVRQRIVQGNPLSYDDILAMPLPISGLKESGRTALVEDLVTFWTRCDYLSALPEGSVIYGDPGWSMEKLVGPVKRFYAGKSLDFSDEAPWIYQRSAININIFNVQCVNSPILRLFDVMACGGFLLCEYKPFLESMFMIGEELDTFRTPSELQEKIAYYRAHSGRRIEIAQAGKERVLKEHRFRDRFNVMFT